MANATGYEGKIGWRLRGSVAANSAWDPFYSTSPTPDTLGAFDLLPAIGENMQERVPYNYDDVFTARSGYAVDGVTATESRIQCDGGVDIEARYNGLGQLIAAALGYERVRTSTTLESPDITLEASGTVTGSTASTLSDSTGPFLAAMIGSWVRLEKKGTNADIYSQVRLVTGVPSATQITVSPDWTDTPAVSTPYTVGRLFTHTYECCHGLHMEPFTEYFADPWNSALWLSRTGTLVSDRTTAGFEYQECAVKSLKLKLDAQSGLIIQATFLPKILDRRVVSRNSSSSSWNYGSQSYTVTDRIQFADSVFRIADFSTSGLSSSDKVGITNLEIEIDNGISADYGNATSYGLEPFRTGFRKVTGSFTVPRHVSSSLLSSDFFNRTVKMADLVFTGPSGTSLSLFLRSLKLDAENISMNGPAAIPERFTFTALQPSSASITGMPAVSSGMESGEIVIQTVDNNPFNYFMGQDNNAGV